MGGKGQLLADGRNETAHHMSPVSLAFLVVHKPVRNTEKSEREERKVTEKFKEKFMKNSEKNSEKRMSICVVKSWRFGVLKLRITHVLQPLILIGKDCSDQPDPCGDFKSRIFQKPNVISLSSSIVFLSQSHGFKVLLYTHSPENSRITVNCSCDTEQGHEDMMMGSHPGERVTACSVRCSILEYLMVMMVIFISPLGLTGDLTLGRKGTTLANGSFIILAKSTDPYDISPCSDELTIMYCFLGLKSLEWYPIGALVFFDCWFKAIGIILITSDRPSKNIDRVISGHLRSGVSQPRQ
ncbi:hypothetical protein IGI04_019113 [Brassica rapa subsp. trilocularis]|uniref:Uncharacterized protein n=1 Tax=Brassica rapa subsp. trilocularis TaxID=1813537 RepID=A0ABQ7MEW3_BRACM|nr:hypothetical protein IGI04_019113 [Brassica rapa subsp. trilocularis]